MPRLPPVFPRLHTLRQQSYETLVPSPYYGTQASYLIAGGHHLRLDATVRHQAVGAKRSDGVNITGHAVQVSRAAWCAVLVGVGAARLAGRGRADRKNVLATGGARNSARLAIGVFISAEVAGGKQQKVFWVLRRNGNEGRTPRRSRQRVRRDGMMGTGEGCTYSPCTSYHGKVETGRIVKPNPDLKPDRLRVFSLWKM